MRKRLLTSVVSCLLGIGMLLAQDTGNVGKIVPIKIKPRTFNGNCILGATESIWDIWEESTTGIGFDAYGYYFWSTARLSEAEGGFPTTLNMKCEQTGETIPFAFQWRGDGIFDGKDCTQLSGTYTTSNQVSLEEIKAYKELYVMTASSLISNEDPKIKVTITYKNGGKRTETSFTATDAYTKNKNSNGYYGITCVSSLYDGNGKWNNKIGVPPATTVGPAFYCKKLPVELDPNNPILYIEFEQAPSENMCTGIFGISGLVSYEEGTPDPGDGGGSDPGDGGGSDPGDTEGKVFTPLTWDPFYSNGNVVRGESESSEDVWKGGIADTYLDPYGCFYYGDDGGLPTSLTISCGGDRSTPFNFQWAGDKPFDGNDCIHLSPEYNGLIVNFDKKRAYSELRVCATGGSVQKGYETIVADINYVDGTAVRGSIVIPDWYQTDKYENGYYGLKRLEQNKYAREDSYTIANGENGKYGPAIYNLPIIVELDPEKAVESITFYQEKEMYTAILAISGVMTKDEDPDDGGGGNDDDDDSNIITEKYNLLSGWNWVSFNLYTNGADDASVLAKGKWTSGDEIKNAYYVDSYYKLDETWIGTLSSHGGINYTDLFKLKVKNGQEITVSGNPLEAYLTSIKIEPQWNYIGYLPTMDMTIDDALYGYEAQEGDILKSQVDFAQYSKENGWVGNIHCMSPGRGYMLYRNASSSTSFNYPSFINVAKKRNRIANNFISKAEDSEHRYSSNMNVIATVEGIELEQNDEIVAYVNGERRSYANEVSLDDKNLWFITIEGNEAAPVIFSVERDGETVASACADFGYKSDDVRGSVKMPTVINFAKTDSGVSVSRKVFQSQFTVSAVKPSLKNVTVEVYSATGQLVLKDSTAGADGSYKHTFDGSDLTNGVYIVRTVADGEPTVIRIIKR